MVAITDLVRRAGNEVMRINPVSETIDIHITSHGSDWLWAAFSVFGVFTIVHAFIYGFTNAKTHTLKKTLLIFPLYINAVLAFAYFTWAANLGYAGAPVEFHHVKTSKDLGIRQIFYSKFIAWFLAWPAYLIIIEISTHTFEYTNSETPVLHKFILLFQGLIVKLLATWVFILGILVGSLIQSTYKWGYFTFSAVFLLFAITLIILNIRESIKATSGARWKHFFISFQLLVWILYPVAWALSEGANVIQPDSEAVFIGVLDLITFAVIPTALTWINVSSIDEGFFGKISHPLASRHGSTGEKSVGDNTPRHSGDTAVPNAAAVVQPDTADATGARRSQEDIV